MGTPYHEWSLELSAPHAASVSGRRCTSSAGGGCARGVVEHDRLAWLLADRVRTEDALQLLHEPELSICCFRLRAGGDGEETDKLNERVLRSLHAEGVHVPSGTTVDGRFALRACLVNPRQTAADVHTLVDAVLAHASRLRG